MVPTIRHEVQWDPVREMLFAGGEPQPIRPGQDYRPAILDYVQNVLGFGSAAGVFAAGAFDLWVTDGGDTAMTDHRVVVEYMADKPCRTTTIVPIVATPVVIVPIVEDDGQIGMF